MNKSIFIAFLFASTLIVNNSSAQGSGSGGAGTFSLGTRNTFSFFNDIPGESAGMGIGGQSRLQLSRRLNTEWYADYITSRIGTYAIRNDYHIGWSVMYYVRSEVDFRQLLQPYLLAGHCFDETVVFGRDNKKNSADRLSMAAQFGAGTHLNISPELDISLSGQYMLHFGQEIDAEQREGFVEIHRQPYTTPEGHLLFTVSANYKFGKLWN